MASSVKDLKQALVKELDNEKINNDERCLDLLKQLDNCVLDVQILKETLIGTIVTKFKSNSNPDVAAMAKKLVKKWKQIVKQSGVVSSGNKTTGSIKNKDTDKKVTNKEKAKIASSSSSKISSKKSTKSKSSKSPEKETTTTEVNTDDWDHLTPYRKNMAQKFHTIFQLSSSKLSSSFDSTAITSLCISRATEVEDSIHTTINSKNNNKSLYANKVRTLVFNLKNNNELRDNLILGTTTAQRLVQMSPAELAPEEKKKERSETVSKANDAMQLDWEQANEAKINEMCGIKGDLLKASLFTCGR